MPRRGVIPWFVLLLPLVCGGLSGCTPFVNATLRAMEQSQQKSLAIATPQEAVELEVFFIERPANDPLTGEALWSELDQIGSVDAATRDRLKANGLRFGIAGRSLPYALQALTRQTRDDGPGRRTTRQQYQTPSGVTHEFPCGEMPNPAVVRLSGENGLQALEFIDGRGVIRCRAERTQAGWATLEVQPEIHHGDLKMRAAATDQSWSWSGGQSVHALYGQRFTVTLNEGESLVLGAVGEQADSAGARMFRAGEAAEPLNRLLVIRLKSLGQVSARTAESR